MDFVKQYFKIVNYILMGLIFGFASFYLLINAYHYLEIRKDFVTEFDTQSLVVTFEDKLNRISDNISNFNLNNYRGNISNSQMSIIHTNLNTCVNSFRTETYQSLRDNNRVTIVDVYKLREAYEDKVLSNCIVNGLYWTTTINDNFGSKYLVDNKQMIQLYINSLLNETTYLKKDLINNSSYFFNTTIASASIKDNTRDGFYEVMDSYNKAASFVEYISDWFKNEVGDNHD